MITLTSIIISINNTGTSQDSFQGGGEPIYNINESSLFFYF